MRIVFAGTPEFAAAALEALIGAGHQVPLVLTQPDRPSGRGMKLRPGPVKALAQEHSIAVAQPRSLRLDGKYPEDAQAAQHALQQAAPELMVVAAYGLILPQWTLNLPVHGCFNIHASLLPRWRGAAPIQRAIEAGDARTGITIMQMDEGLDTGDMLLERELPITDAHTASRLHDELARLGAEAILEAVALLEKGLLRARPQPEEGVTYAAKLDKAEAALDFTQPAAELARRVRAFDPVPGATARLPGLEQPVKIWSAQALQGAADAAPGTLLNASSEGLDFATAEGILRVLSLQKAGGKRQPVEAFVQGWNRG
ncbi:MAG: methionyl-tRNA formyltransferase [Alcaligenaceae bacterium]|nr:methionyl-tRNA formyltransferase [Alcaligenaceae bacterium]